MNKRFVLGISNFSFSDEVTHVNKMPFSGVCAFVDTPSDGSPCGADGKKVVFTREAVEKALETFVGMGVNVVWDDGMWSSSAYAMTGHDERFKVGVVETAEVEGNEIQITGSLWKYDFPDVCFMVKNAKDSLGFSIEVCVTDMEDREGVLYVTAFTFTGVAIMYADLAAFKQTKLAASAAKRSDLMNEEQIRALLAEAQGQILEAVKAASEAKLAELEALLAKATEQVETFAAQLSEANEKLAQFAEREAALTAENAGLKEKLEAFGIELSEVKEGKADKVVRKSVQFTNTLAKYEGEEKTVDMVCKEISEDTTLTESQKWQLKLEAWRKQSSK